MTSFEKKKGKDLYNEKCRKPNVKVKNPCKICSETVNLKTGLQCKGACKKWAHYECLYFSDSQIEDIQCGFLKINCPCPDCENDSKINQAQANAKSKEPSSVKKEFRSKFDNCNKTFCPGVPQKKSIKGLDNLNALKNTLKPIPFGVSEGTSYECTIEKSKDEIKQNEDVDCEEDNEEQENEEQDDEDEEKSDVEVSECKYQTVLLVKSSSQLTAAICCDTSRLSPVNQGVVTKEPCSKKLEVKCCVGGTCSTSSSSSDKEKSGLKKKKDQKTKERKREKKDKREKKKRKGMCDKKGEVKKGDTSPCCSGGSCCNSGSSQGSKKSIEPSESETSVTSISSKSTRSTQAPCGLISEICQDSGAISPIKQMKSEGCNVNVDGRGPPSPKAPRQMSQKRLPSGNPSYPPIPRSTHQQLQKQHPIPPSHGTQLNNCSPGCQGMKSASKCLPNCPGPGIGRGQNDAAQLKDTLKPISKCGACLPGCCDPNRAKTVALPRNSSTYLVSTSPTNRSKSCCTLDKSNKKEGTNISTDVSAHLAKLSKSDTKTLDQQQLDDYNRKMLLIALERMCQTMGQFSVQFRELMNKITEKMDTKRLEELK